MDSKARDEQQAGEPAKERRPAAGDVSRRSLVLGTGSALAMAAAGVLPACGGGGGEDEAEERFGYGVASGDPLADRVILWTRVNVTFPTEVAWEVATDLAFTSIVRSGVAATSADHDWTVKVDATGLQPATSYFYRFRHEGRTSPVGRTKTLPSGSPQQVRIAVFSCAAYPLGQFHAYNHAANRTDIDVALMLGDYIYELGLNNAEQAAAALIGREIDPRGELHTLAEYRQRYARYHTDSDLRGIRATTPIIAVWDDHEIVNDIWRGGAGGHDPATEGSFEARRAAAVQAFHEWLPTRTGPDPLKIYRSFDFGNLLSLHMLETRVLGRDAPIGRDAYLAGAAADPARQLLGAEQEQWLHDRMQASAATWQVIGQQVVMGPMQIPLTVFDDFTEDRINDFLQALDTPEASRTDAQKGLIAQPRIGYELTNWDGFQSARERLLSNAHTLDKNLVVLSGDSHNAFAHDLRDATGQHVGVEYAAPSVTSTGLEISHPSVGRSFLASAFTRMIPDLKYAETSHRGYLTLTVTPGAVAGDWIFVSSVLSNSYSTSAGPTLLALPGAANRKLVPAV